MLSPLSLIITGASSSWAGNWEVTERQYPTQADILKDAWKDMTLVGRVRDDHSRPNTINLWCVADNLRKGAATNVVQIAEKMIARGFWPDKV